MQKHAVLSQVTVEEVKVALKCRGILKVLLISEEVSKWDGDLSTRKVKTFPPVVYPIGSY